MSIKEAIDPSDKTETNKSEIKRISKRISNSNSEDIENNSRSTLVSSNLSESTDKIVMQMIKVELIVGDQGNKKSVSILSQSNAKLYIIIEKAIQELNFEFQMEKSKFSLNGNANNYSLQKIKNTSDSSEESECFDNENTVGETGENKFTLVWREDPSDYKSYFTKDNQFNQEDTGGSCFLF